MARPGVRPGAQERPRRPVRRRPAVQLAPQDGGRRPCRGRRAGGGRAGPSCACATSPGASATSPASSTSTASWCATRSRGARCSMRCRCRPGSAMRRPHPMGQRGLRARPSRPASEREVRERQIELLGDAPARGGRRGAGQGHTLPRARAPHQRRRAQGPRRRGHPARGRQRRRGHRRGGAGDGAGRAGAARGGLRAHARPGGDRRRHLRPRPAAHVLQRGLSHAVAARCRLARHQAVRRRAARPPARAVAPAGGA